MSENSIKTLKQEEIKIKTNKFLSISTVHGIQNILNANFLQTKLLWFICMIVSVSFCGYFILLSIMNYLSREAVIVIDTIYEDKSYFPTVSFCNSFTPFGDLNILKCTFNRDKCNHYFQEFTNPSFGKCYRFNSGFNITDHPVDILYSTAGGSSYGFNFDLNISSNYDFNEMFLLIHNHTYKPNNIRNKAYRLISGSINTIIIDRVFDEKLDFPFNDCYRNYDSFKKNKTIIEFIKNKNDSYTRVECIRICRNLNTKEKSGCNCVDSIESAIDCQNSLNKSVVDCYNNFLTEFQKKSVLDICSEYCPLECDTITINAELYTEQLPTSGPIIKKTTKFEYLNFGTYEQVKKSFFSFRIYYDDLKYTHIKQNPKIESVDLVSSIGGTLGLFLGISFLSFIEIIDLFIEIIIIWRS